MKKTLFPTLALTLLVLGVAGIAWAGQAEVQAPEEPLAETPAPDQAPETSLPAEGVELDEITLEELFQDPVEVDSCCAAQCFEERKACINDCPPWGEPGASACRTECNEANEACLAGC